MAETEEIRPSVHDSLQQVTELLRRHRQNLLQQHELPRPQEGEALLHEQNLVALQSKLEQLHPADVAYILETLPWSRIRERTSRRFRALHWRAVAFLQRAGLMATRGMPRRVSNDPELMHITRRLDASAPRND